MSPIPSAPNKKQRSGEASLYRRVANDFAARISDGSLKAGARLPTVRAYAQENGLSLGTVKHAYDVLSQMGYIEKTQGRGTFVRDILSGGGMGRKDTAMAAIDAMLETMDALGFSPDETRIFVDLKLREREAEVQPVRLAAVDCSPEALWVMRRQLSGFSGVEVTGYPLAQVLSGANTFQPDADLIVTTPTHYDVLSAKAAPGAHVVRLVMAISRRTLVELARMGRHCRVGILAESERFASVMLRSCRQYAALEAAPQTALFAQADAVERVLAGSERIILPSNYLQFCGADVRERIRAHTEKVPPILFEYRVEKGSLLALEEEIRRVRE